MSNKAKEEITVVAELTVTSSQGSEVIKQFDRAWARAQELAETTLPVSIKLNGFVRKD